MYVLTLEGGRERDFRIYKLTNQLEAVIMTNEDLLLKSEREIREMKGHIRKLRKGVLSSVMKCNFLHRVLKFGTE